MSSFATDTAAEAETVLTKALAVHPGDTALTAQPRHHLPGRRHDPAKSALAVPLVETLHQQHPDEPSVTRLLARLYAQSKQPEKADPLYAALLKLTPNDPTLHRRLRRSNLLHLRRYPEAETVLKRAVAESRRIPFAPTISPPAYNRPRIIPLLRTTTQQ